MAVVHRVQARYYAELDGLPSGAAPSPELIDVAWMIEELRVSLFAQTLGAARSISEKRVLQAIEAASSTR
jgi:ATP-dependent helicase HrpA